MKNLILILTSALTIFCHKIDYKKETLPKSRLYVSNISTNVFSEKDQSNKILGTLHLGDSIEIKNEDSEVVLNENTKWLEIDFNGKKGFIDQTSLRKNPPNLILAKDKNKIYESYIEKLLKRYSKLEIGAELEAEDRIQYAKEVDFFEELNIQYSGIESYKTEFSEEYKSWIASNFDRIIKIDPDKVCSAKSVDIENSRKGCTENKISQIKILKEKLKKIEIDSITMDLVDIFNDEYCKNLYNYYKNDCDTNPEVEKLIKELGGL